MNNNNNYQQLPPDVGQPPLMYPPQPPQMYPPPPAEQNNPPNFQNYPPPQSYPPPPPQNYPPPPQQNYPPPPPQNYPPPPQDYPPPPPQNYSQPPQMIQPQQQGYIPPSTTAFNQQQQQMQGIYPRSANNQIGPSIIQCPQCNQVTTTVVNSQPGSGTYCCACLLFCTFTICCFIPFCNDDCQDKIHHCAHCGALVGRHEYKPC
ncbi:LITAF-like zinc ribbon domain protein (macronuclear) [Tetrahymena thermophila SB210]|uniref:LITAF-like zinc ribbon domain protein n=1 Tax=Tetrahymena thermophila (strain SB210) TaxID=312017 RepID=Q22CA6_TETTS|nr:LITAF-like zinc ribbon domain protein [Tetrahymena thermophila SB210]EAR82901.1 LITAF-like zinc ribbon domain protein [Tetrahymena thermophila SB210]|eukprot:XP_001030564.1 LITAF-like zinc ribbon domain protein [Tetrahymena thermophila SB210]